MTVHPRSRGEHLAAGAVLAAGAGSSPLARGTQRGAVVGDRDLRFIPARAGNTGSPVAGSAPTPVHPRSRGEHSASRTGMASPIGSSPLARGTPPPARRGAGRPRFIPARAGNTRPRTILPCSCSVHPRSRGEHWSACSRSRAAAGSSPLARGTRAYPARGAHAGRFIPARAGNTRPRRSRARRGPVHPRSRGEHGGEVHRHRRVRGSSPLARGTRSTSGCGRRRTRFIPARAGNTPHASRDRAERTVHPRSRGEHSSDLQFIPGEDGSSPLARGTPHGPA